MVQPDRGDIWLVDLNPAQGREQAGKKPALIISVDLFNKGPAELAIVLPVTTREKNIPFHVSLTPPEGGTRQASYIQCEDIRSISKQRLSRKWGSVSARTLAAVEDRLRILLKL